MILAIDATNIRAGGGLTHLKEVLSNGEPVKYGIKTVVVWSNESTLKALPEKDWLIKMTHSWLNKSFIFSFLFQIFHLTNQTKEKGADVLFVPGGTFLGGFSNVVTMSQNMLPFEKKERNRFNNWKTKLRFYILKRTQSYTFKKSKAVIFLTQYAKTYIEESINLQNKTAVIPHGISLGFLQHPKQQIEIEKYSFDEPYKFLYVSIVTAYKHQWNVAKAILKLRSEGYPVSLQLVGGSNKIFLHKLRSVLTEDVYDCIVYEGQIDYEVLSSVYKSADGFIFASSCENQPIILLEAMSAGLPIACSDMGPMPEVLEDAGFYFNPLDMESIYQTLKVFLHNKNERQLKAEKAYNKSINYTWKDCSDKTFEFLSGFKKE